MHQWIEFKVVYRKGIVLSFRPPWGELPPFYRIININISPLFPPNSCDCRIISHFSWRRRPLKICGKSQEQEIGDFGHGGGGGGLRIAQCADGWDVNLFSSGEKKSFFFPFVWETDACPAFCISPFRRRCTHLQRAGRETKVPWCVCLHACPRFFLSSSLFAGENMANWVCPRNLGQMRRRRRIKVGVRIETSFFLLRPKE